MRSHLVTRILVFLAVCPLLGAPPALAQYSGSSAITTSGEAQSRPALG